VLGEPSPDIPPIALPATYLYQPHQEKAIPGHISQQDVEFGKWTVEQLITAGRILFLAQFTRFDGAGRPGATGNPSPTRRPLGTGVAFSRTAGPDANACVSCHNRPSVGGAGDFVSNVFTGLGSRHPIFTSIDSNFSAERDTPDMNGAGAIELLAREMTFELHSIRDQARSKALAGDKTLRVPLVAKGVRFGSLIAEHDGTIRLNEVEGVDRDLVVRPWGQKGVVTSLRTFTVNAMNLHHGMQATERFGFYLTGSEDFDRDGTVEELTEGDITALVLFQATLSLPGQVIPFEPEKRQLVKHGEAVFRNSRCASCHTPELPLNSSIFTEPSPFNLEGTLRRSEVSNLVSIDLLMVGPTPRLKTNPDGRILVRAFTDLKRHRISDNERQHFGNEVVVEGLTSTDEFLTKRLWATGSTAPYGHRGDLTTILDAIEYHGGEARDARLEFTSMPQADRTALIAFLESLQILPNGSPPQVLAPEPPTLPYSPKQEQ
jgi:hypothetical protein